MSGRRRAALLLALATGLTGALPAPAALAAPVPPTPSGLPAGVEDLQPYVGQLGCDPVAKPGVAAFQQLLMETYPDTDSLGIVRDCGIGGRSEHKEGRALDWAVSAYDPADVEAVDAVVQWLTETVDGVPAARARRLGLMYMIWDGRIWESYDLAAGWQPYSGASPHTDHVHFSFGWNGAQQDTSWWTGRVAPVDYGPYVTGQPGSGSVVPVRRPANLRVLAEFGGTTQYRGSTGPAVVALQGALRVGADGHFGPVTEAAVRQFQADQGLTADGVFGPEEWARLFPRPVDPFGEVESAGATGVSGWAADADGAAPLPVQAWVDGVPYGPPGTAARPRPEIAGSYPGAAAYGWSLPLDLPAGTSSVCVVAGNTGPGAVVPVGCSSVTATQSQTRDGRWTDALHRDLLGRPATDAEQERFAAPLRATAPDRAALALAVARSDEHLDRVVARLYADLLRRGATPEERAGWRAALAAGRPQRLVAASFLASSEYAVRSGGTDDGWVTAVYADVLGRAPSAAERAAWRTATVRLGRTVAARALLAAPEALARRVDAQYRLVLGRPADPAGTAAFWQLLHTRGEAWLTASLTASVEYVARAETR